MTSGKIVVMETAPQVSFWFFGDVHFWHQVWVSRSSYSFAYARAVNISCYYMALSHKDWKLPNAWIWLAEMDIDRGLDFPI